MEETPSVRAALPRILRRPPADILAVLIATALVNIVVFAPVVRETPLRIPAGLAFVLLVPGYAVVAALFPRSGETGPAAPEERTRSWWGRIDGIDRLALSVALSVSIVPLIGVALTATPGGVRLEPFLAGVSILTVLVAIVAARRRSVVPPDDRFRVPYREWLATARSTVRTDTRGEAALNVALIGAVLLALGSVGYAAAVLPQDDQFSSLSVQPADGEEIGPDEPLLEVAPGESQEITVGVENQEDRTVTYTVVVVEQEMDGDGDEPAVSEQRELDRFEAQVDDGETWHHTHDVEPTTDEDVRIAWLLYVDDVPDDPSADGADYHVHLWPDVVEEA